MLLTNLNENGSFDFSLSPSVGFSYTQTLCWLRVSGLAFTTLGQAETGSISDDLNAFGHTIDQLSQLGQEHAQDERHVFVEPMKDMARNLKELKSALKRRTEAYHMLLVCPIHIVELVVAWRLAARASCC